MDISSWLVVSQEARGLDPKDWVVAPSHVQDRSREDWWLFKPIKSASYRRCDDWSEKVAAELAGLMGLPAARVELAKGQSDEGIISRNVVPDGWSMESGDTLLSEVEGYVSCVGDDRPSNRVGHNLENIADVLADVKGPPGSEWAHAPAVEVFAGYLVFDAWIANTDRHAINWSVLTRDDVKALAATFDHGSALASGVQDARLATWAPRDFAARGYAGRFEDGDKRTLRDLALEAVRHARGDAEMWLDRLASIDPADVRAVLAGVTAMSDVRRRFLASVLDINRERLTA